MRHKPLKIPKHDLPLHFAITNKLTPEVRWLIEGGTNVDARDGNKRTPLMLCCLENDEFWAAGVTRMLLQAGADASLRDANGRNALTFAVIFLKKSIVDILLQAVEYDVNQRDLDGKSALNYAIFHGDINIIDTLTRACGENVLAYSDPHFNTRTNKRTEASNEAYTWRTMASVRLPSKVEKEHLSLRQRPQSICKTIIQSEKSSARIHQSNSVMNVHKFRRGTMQDFLLKTNRRRTSTSTGSRSWSSSSHRSVSLDLTDLHSRPYAMSERQRIHHTGLNQSSDFQNWRSKEQNEGWKSYVPMFWHVLTEQCCPSYRPSAKPVAQSLEEALGIPPKEEIIDEEILIQEGVSRNAKNLAASRRSSMPNSPSPTLDVPAFQNNRRRYSEASIALSASVPNLKSALSDMAERNGSNIAPIEFTAKTKIVKKSVTPTSKEESVKNKENISIDISPPQTPLRTAPLRRSDSLNIPKQSALPARTSTLSNRPGSALRPQPVRRQTTDGLPIIKVDTSQAKNSNNTQEKLTPINPQTVSPSAKNDIRKQKTNKSQVNDSQTPARVVQSKPQTKASLAKDEIPDQEKTQNNVAKRIQRRPESILFRNRVLSDIVEENENQNILDGQNKLTSAAKNRMLNIRPTSAYVRGRLANGRS